MRVEEELAHFSTGKETLLTIGVFDGVHLGHQFLISKLVKLAREQGYSSGVITFRQHPLELLSPGTEILYLTTVSEREQLIKALGVDFVIPLTFDKELANLSARDFVSLLTQHLKMRGLIIGPDFVLGKDREGNAAALRLFGEDLGFTVTAAATKKIGGEVASSTTIRKALANGEMEKVNHLLGRPFNLHGEVITGEGRGTGLGFPTINLKIDDKKAIPPDGVYVSTVYVDGEQYKAVTNIGKCPTFGQDHAHTVESFILNYNKNTYGKDVKLEIIQRLRGEKCFDNVEELKKQIAEDVRLSAEILNKQVIK